MEKYMVTAEQAQRNVKNYLDELEEKNKEENIYNNLLQNINLSIRENSSKGLSKIVFNLITTDIPYTHRKKYVETYNKSIVPYLRDNGYSVCELDSIYNDAIISW